MDGALNCLLGSLSNDYGDGNENGKKAIGTYRLVKQHNFARASYVQHAFLVLFLPLLHDYDVKRPNFTFYEGREQLEKKIYFFFF